MSPAALAAVAQEALWPPRSILISGAPARRRLHLVARCRAFFLKRGSKRGKSAAGNISADRVVMITEIVPYPDCNDPIRLLGALSVALPPRPPRHLDFSQYKEVDQNRSKANATSRRRR